MQLFIAYSDQRGALHHTTLDRLQRSEVPCIIQLFLAWGDHREDPCLLQFLIAYSDQRGALHHTTLYRLQRSEVPCIIQFFIAWGDHREDPCLYNS